MRHSFASAGRVRTENSWTTAGRADTCHDVASERIWGTVEHCRRGFTWSHEQRARVETTSNF